MAARQFPGGIDAHPAAMEAQREDQRDALYTRTTAQRKARKSRNEITPLDCPRAQREADDHDQQQQQQFADQHRGEDADADQDHQPEHPELVHAEPHEGKAAFLRPQHRAEHGVHQHHDEQQQAEIEQQHQAEHRPRPYRKRRAGIGAAGHHGAEHQQSHDQRNGQRADTIGDRPDCHRTRPLARSSAERTAENRISRSPSQSPH